MTESNRHSALERPLVFTPFLKQVVWGGNRICRMKDMQCRADNIGESWEVSPLPGFESVVEEGSLKGRTLNDLAAEYGEALLGTDVAARYGTEFPLLIKFIDAHSDLSLQVHPDDRIAAERHGARGKDEMWYVIDTAPGAAICAGLSKCLNPVSYEAAVADGSIAGMLNCFKPKPGDVFFLGAGLVHAIGAGNLVAEIQVASDITYRIFDYNRPDINGRPRELHTHLAKDAIDFNGQPYHRHCDRPLPGADEELVDSRCFDVRRLCVSGTSALRHSRRSFTVLMCVEGACSIVFPGGSLSLAAGHTALIPAQMAAPAISGDATLLAVTAK